nr:invasion associated locus B family protein [uncultured Cohaesibacter sp.]
MYTQVPRFVSKEVKLSSLLKQTLYAAIASLVLIGITPTAFAAQQAPRPKPEISKDPAVTTATYGNWVLRCVSAPVKNDSPNSKAKQSNKNCEIIQTVQVKGHAQPIAQLALGHLPDNDTIVMTAVLPVNVSIPGSVLVASMEGSDKAQKSDIALQWTRCAGQACFAVATPKSDTLGQLRKASSGKLEFVDANSRVVAIPLSFAGLDPALDALQKEK